MEDGKKESEENLLLFCRKENFSCIAFRLACNELRKLFIPRNFFLALSAELRGLDVLFELISSETARIC